MKILGWEIIWKPLVFENCKELWCFPFSFSGDISLCCFSKMFIYPNFTRKKLEGKKSLFKTIEVKHSVI